MMLMNTETDDIVVAVPLALNRFSSRQGFTSQRPYKKLVDKGKEG